jgi:hypothetical protein
LISLAIDAVPLSKCTRNVHGFSMAAVPATPVDLGGLASSVGVGGGSDLGLQDEDENA